MFTLNQGLSIFSCSASEHKKLGKHSQDSWPSQDKGIVYTTECHAQHINWGNLARRHFVALEQAWRQSDGGEQLHCKTLLLGAVSLSPFHYYHYYSVVCFNYKMVFVSTHKAYFLFFFLLDSLPHWGQRGGVGECEWVSVWVIETTRERWNKLQKEKTEKLFQRDCRTLGMIVVLYPHCWQFPAKRKGWKWLMVGLQHPLLNGNHPWDHHRELAQPCERGAGAIRTFIECFLLFFLIKKLFLFWFKV